MRFTLETAATGKRPASYLGMILGTLTLLTVRPAVAAYEIVSVSNGGMIDGVVTWVGKAPSAAALKITKNQDYCGHAIADPTYMVDAGGGLANVIVYLKGITRGKPAPTEPVALVNANCMFSPRAQGAMVRGRVKMSSEDMVLHNTHAQNSDNDATLINVALPFKGFAVTKPLPALPMMINVKCDAHEWMHAWIMELEHPYYTTTSADGHFSINDIPPGTYTLAVWHEAAGEQSTVVAVTGNEITTAKFAMGAK